jgi:methionyl-tRNA formyltransferase
MNIIASNRQFPNRNVTNPEELDQLLLGRIEPKYIFFPFWSWKVPSGHLNNYTCIGFHMTDLPFGRGGQPYENLRKRGIWDTKMSAFKFTEKWDEGNIYLKRDFRISDTKEKTIEEAIPLISEMIEYIVKNDPVPVPQTGKVTIFRRVC